MLAALALFFAWASLANAQQVTITSPANGSVFAPGATINVTATATSPIVAVKVGAQDMGTSAYRVSPPYLLTLTVPSDVVGPRNLFAVGLITDYTTVVSPTITVDIEPSTPPTAINFQQTLVALDYVGQERRVGVTATFADGSTLDVTKSTLLSFVSGSPTVVAVDATGMMTALAPGNATITATYGTLTATLQTAGPSGIPGDLDGDGIITQQDLLLLETMLGSTPASPNDARDINGDGKIDNLDVQALLAACGANCPSLNASTTSLASSPSQVQYMQPITLTATVTGNAPTGAVSFLVDGQQANTGILGNGGQASATSHSLSIGSHAVAALYGGDAKNGPSSSTPINVKVVAVPGDANGDGMVDCVDLYLVKAAFGKRTGQPGFNPGADLNHDGIVNALDLSIVARAVPAGTTCP